MGLGVIDQDPWQTPGNGSRVLDLVIQDLQERAQLGLRKYGYPLRPHQNRDALVDLYQELLDAVMYLRQYLEEEYEGLDR